jgi:FAD/FMN-containing dehydrogenase
MNTDFTFLQQLLPSDAISFEKHDLQFYGQDACKEFLGNPSVIIFPQTIEEVSKVLAACNEKGIRVVPSGGRTGYSGGATATNKEIVLSLSRMNKILSFSEEASLLTCQAGVTTEAIQKKAEQEGLFFGVDISSKGSSQIGGNVATNAGGIRVIRHGLTRDWVVGLKVVLANGEVLSLNGDLIKNQTGYDFRHLFIGSEGTLGVIVEVTVRLRPQPKESVVALVAADQSERFFGILAAFNKKGIPINVFEYIDDASMQLVVKHKKKREPFLKTYTHYCLIDFEATDVIQKDKAQDIFSESLEVGILQDVVIAESTKHARDLYVYRDAISESIRENYFPHKYDISGPVHSFAGFIYEIRLLLSYYFQECAAFYFGHIGDGNLHISLVKPETMSREVFHTLCKQADEKVFTLISKFGGSISAEHGIGLLRKPYLAMSRTENEIILMRQIKSVFDPKGILNPGKIFNP